MRKLIILVVLIACCAAKPLNNEDEHIKEYGRPLQRPSPINPIIPSDPKPAEKITKITDPKEIAKYKREIEKDGVTPLLPTVQPEEPHTHDKEADKEQTPAKCDSNACTLHVRQKREQKHAAPVDDKSDQHKPTPKPALKSQPTPAPPSRKRKETSSSTPSPAPPKQPTAPVHTSQKHRQKRDDAHVTPSSTVAAVPLIYRNEQEKSVASVSHDVPSSVSTNGFVKPQTLPATLPAGDPALQPLGSHAAVRAKRDIPVPLVPKHEHPEESPKDEQEKHSEEKQQNSSEEEGNEKKDNKSEESNEKTDNQSKENTHEKKDNVQVEDLSDKVPSHEQHKREEQHNNDNSVSTSSTTTEHALVRQQAVPVAELLGNRPKQ